MTINSSYNFGLLTNDGNGTPTSLQNLKSFTVNLNSNNEWVVDSSLKDYFVNYYNTTQSSPAPGGFEYNGLVVYNKKGKNFVILLQNSLQLTITQSNFISFTGPNTLPNITNLTSTSSITYPELPTFINGYNGYNIPKGTLSTTVNSYIFYIID